MSTTFNLIEKWKSEQALKISLEDISKVIQFLELTQPTNYGTIAHMRRLYHHGVNNGFFRKEDKEIIDKYLNIINK